LKGAVFPFQVKSLENEVDDLLHAVHVNKADHGAGAALYFHEQRSMMLSCGAGTTEEAEEGQ
jgi:hypothetical protein